MSAAVDTGVVIIGGGVVGMALALLLARGGLETALVDKRIALPQADGDATTAAADEPPALALTPASIRILQHLAVWEHLPPARYGEFDKMFVWEEQGDAAVAFDGGEIDASPLGAVVPQRHLLRAMRRRVEDASLVRLFDGYGPAALGLERPRKSVQLAPASEGDAARQGLELRCELIVAADGRASPTRRLADIPVAAHDYRQTALSCRVSTARPHERIARQKFLATGPLAFLPLREPHTSCVVWSLDQERADALSRLDARRFAAELERAATSDRPPGGLGLVRACGARLAMPLFRSHAARYCRPGLALVGDAAHSAHPLAGQGANLGLLDAAALAEVALRAWRRGRDPGGLAALRRYERWRRGENSAMLWTLDGLKRVYAAGAPPVGALRNLGVRGVNAMPPLKRWIMRRASGLSGDLPEIVRG